MLERFLKTAMGMAEPAYAGFPGHEMPRPVLARVAQPARFDQSEASPGIEVALLSWSQMAEQVPAWQALHARALEPHVFMAPGFALHAAQHAALAQRPAFLTITDTRCDP